MTAESNLTAIVLGAGRSTRMGHDKNRLDLDGEPALARVLRSLRAASVNRIVCVLAPVQNALRRAVDLRAVTCAINPDPRAGQTSSIRIAAQNVPAGTDLVLLCPVDVPLFEAEDVSALVAAFADRRSGESIVVPSHDGRRGHPALFTRDVVAEFGALGDDEPEYVVVRRDPARVRHVERSNAWLVRDLDTPEDLAAAQAYLRSLKG